LPGDGRIVGADDHVEFEPFIGASRQTECRVFANADNPSAMVFVGNRNRSRDPIEEIGSSEFVTGPDMIFNYQTEMAQ